MSHHKGRREDLDALLERAWEGQRKKKLWAEKHPIKLPEVERMDNEPNGNEHIGTKDWILLFLALAAAAAVFMIPRTPNSVIATTFVLLVLLLLSAWYLPYVVGRNRSGRIWRRLLPVLVTILLVGGSGYWAWSEVVEEVKDDVAKNISASVSLFSDNVFASLFTFTNGSGYDIESQTISCLVNEESSADHYISPMVRPSFGEPPLPILIKAGGDGRSTECLRALLHDPEFYQRPIQCADVTLKMDYKIMEFPHRRDHKDARFRIMKTSSGYIAGHEPVLGSIGTCSGKDLYREISPLERMIR